MTTMHKLVITLATLLAVLAGSAPAHASGRDVILDCTDDEVLSKTYSQKEYSDALEQFPTDADQYGACRDIIARAQDAAATKGSKKGGKSGGGSGSGADAGGGGGTSASGAGGQSAAAPPRSASEQLDAASDEDRAAVEDATREAPEASVGPGNPVRTANVGRAPGSQISDLPAPLLVLLALLAAGGLALGGMRIRSLVHARRA